MKPTFFIVVISFILLGSCSTINSTKNIEDFEQTLGKNNSKALTEYVNAFESEVLKKKYPSLETDKAYSKLLSDYPNSLAPTKLYNLFTNYNLDKYFKSHLWYEIYAPVDSVWIENSELKVKYVYLSVDGKKDVGEIESEFKPKMNRDSIIKNEMGVCYFNSKGKYLMAIESIKNGIPFLEEYYSIKNNFGEISTSLFADMINRHNLDLKNYLVRRIVAVEMSKYINDAREPEKNTFANNCYNK